MTILELLFVGIGLSMDAFAVAICKGLSMKKLNFRFAVIIALFFGAFQGLMPFLGWFLGMQFAQYITQIDHWIAFILLCFIGVNMIKEALHPEAERCEEFTLNYKELFMLAIATSIDALAVGITFAFLQVDIVIAISLIGITTFLLSLVGVVCGHYFGAKYQHKAELAGGMILVLIGTKILLEHLGIF